MRLGRTHVILTNYLSPNFRSSSSSLMVTTCREITVEVKESGVAIEGVLVKIGLIEVMTNASGIAVLKGVIDGNQTLTISKVGYTTISEGIAISSDLFLSKVLTISTSITASQFNNLVVEPTISAGRITVENMDIPVPFNWSVYAIDGTIVKEGAIIKKGESIVDLTSTAQGVYIIKFWVGNKIETRKLMIKR